MEELAFAGQESKDEREAGVATSACDPNGSTLDRGANPVQEFGTNPTANLATGGMNERFTRASAAETDNYLTDLAVPTGAACFPALRPRRPDGVIAIVFSLPFDPARASN